MKEQELSLALEEAGYVCEFEPLTRAAALRAVLTEGEEFFARPASPAVVAAAAFAILFTDSADDTAVPAELLRAAEQLDRAEAARALLLCEVRERAFDPSMTALHCEQRAARVAAWARARAAGAFSDDALAGFTEALAETRLSAALPVDPTERPTAALGRARPERATAEMAACAPGVRLLLQAGAPRPADEVRTAHPVCMYGRG